MPTRDYVISAMTLMFAVTLIVVFATVALVKLRVHLARLAGRLSNISRQNQR